nr:hypothetical protein [Mesorhizobium silamurunense]
MRPQHRRPSDRHGLEPLEDTALHVNEEPECGVGGARSNRDEQNAGQLVIHVRIRTRVDRAAEDVDEQQHHGDRHDAVVMMVSGLRAYFLSTPVWLMKKSVMSISWLGPGKFEPLHASDG